MNKEKEIKSLNEDLALVQLRKSEKETIEKVNLKGKFNLLPIITGVITLFCVAMAVFPSPITLYITGGIILTVGMTIAGVDLIKLGLYFRKENKKVMSALFELKERGDLDKIKFDEKQVLDEIKKEKQGLITPKLAREEDFYSEKMLNYIATEGNKEESKYDQTLKKQHSKPNIELYNYTKNNPDSKEDVVDRIMYELDAYCLGLNLPPIEISNNEWQIFFDTLYDVFCQRNAAYDFYNEISRLCRITLSNSLINKSEYISIKDFIDSIEYLGEEFSFFAISLTESEVTTLKSMLNEKVNSKKTIAFQLVRKK